VKRGFVTTIVAVLIDDQHVTNRQLTHGTSVTVGDNGAVGNERFVLGGMSPDPALLAPARADDWIQTDGRPTPAYREDLRRIPDARNAVSVVMLYAQTAAIIVAASKIGNPLTWIIAFLLMGRTHAQFLSLMHEAAHRTLFSNKRLNDFVGNWLLGFPDFTSTPAYRRVHMAHHREEFGPDEPDIPLYANYPVSTASLRRKLTRDALGITGFKLFRAQLRGLRSNEVRVRRTQQKIWGLQVALFAAAITSGHPWLYPMMWFLPNLTVWRVINRLRSIAEHGGMRAGPDRRMSTHAVRQRWFARFFLVPYNIGFHTAHHVDPGVPFRNLPSYTQQLRDAGYITPEREYASYPRIWKALAGASRPA
jgi:fatty acid desaturase